MNGSVHEWLRRWVSKSEDVGEWVVGREYERVNEKVREYLEIGSRLALYLGNDV